MHVTFKGDIRLVAARAIEAATGYVPKLDQITCPCDIQVWMMKPVKFFATCNNDEYAILHPSYQPKSTPFAYKYPTALNLIEGLGLDVLKIETKEQWYVRIKARKDRQVVGLRPPNDGL